MSMSTVFFVGIVIYYAVSGLGLLGGGASADEAVDFRGAEELTHVAEGRVAELRTFGSFEAAVETHKDNTGVPLVVDFYSNGCGPCRMIAPTYKELALEYAGRAAFVKVDVNRNYETSRHCGVRAMPTFQFYVGGKLAHSFSGADSRQLRAT